METMTLEGLLAEGQRKIEEQDRQEAERERRQQAEAERERRQQWAAVEAAAWALLPSCLHEHLVLHDTDYGPDSQQVVEICAPGCVPLYCRVAWRQPPPKLMIGKGGANFWIKHHSLERSYDYEPDLDEPGKGGPAYVRTWHDHPIYFSDLDVALAYARQVQERVAGFQAKADAENAEYWRQWAEMQSAAREAEAAREARRLAEAKPQEPPIDYLEGAIDTLDTARGDHPELYSIGLALVALVQEMRAGRRR